MKWDDAGKEVLQGKAFVLYEGRYRLKILSPKEIQISETLAAGFA